MEQDYKMTPSQTMIYWTDAYIEKINLKLKSRNIPICLCRVNMDEFHNKCEDSVCFSNPDSSAGSVPLSLIMAESRVNNFLFNIDRDYCTFKLFDE